MNESQIIKDLKDDSQHALREIYQLYAAQLFAFGLRYAKSQEVVEELVEDTFIWLWTNRHSIRQTETLRPVLFIRMKTFLINAYWNRVHSPIFEDYLIYANEQAPNPAEKKLEYDDFLKQLNSAIDRLPETQRKVVRLSKINEMSNKDIARKLNLQEQTIKNQLSAGLKSLRKMLELPAILFYFLFYVN